MTSDRSDATDGGRGRPEWDEALADARGIAEEYREDGWDAVVLEPTAVRPVDDAERTALAAAVSDDEYELLERLVAEEGGAFDDAEVYYRAADGGEPRIALAVERAPTRETAVIVPLVYALEAVRGVLETALVEAELQVSVGPADAEERVVFAHDDPSLFLEERDVREWSGE